MSCMCSAHTVGLAEYPRPCENIRSSCRARARVQQWCKWRSGARGAAAHPCSGAAVQRRSVCMTRCARLGPAAHHFFMLASSSGVAFGHLLAQSSSVVLQMIGPLRTLKPPPRLLLLCESGTSLGRPCDGNWRAEAHGSSSTNRAARTIAAPNEIVVMWRVFSALSRPISAVQLGQTHCLYCSPFLEFATCTHLSPELGEARAEAESSW